MKKATLSAMVLLTVLALAVSIVQFSQAATYSFPTGPLVPPTISLESPTATTYNSWYVPLQFTVDGIWDGYVNHFVVKYVIDDGLPTVALAASYPVSKVNRNVALTLGPLSEGTHHVQVFATVGGIYRLAQDSNVLGSGDFTSQASVTFTVDTSGSTQISVLSPKNVIYSSNKDIPVQFILNKTTSIESMGYSLDGKSNVTIPRNTTLYGPIPDGEHSLKVYALYSDVLPAALTVNFTVDTTPPQVKVDSIEDKLYDTPEVPLIFNVNETTSLITYILDDKVFTISGNSTLTDLQDGDHKITVYATDQAGNAAPSETIDFKVQVPIPQQTAYAVLPPMIIVLVGGFSILIYIEKRKQTALRKHG